jgi:hypothetical protein
LTNLNPSVIIFGALLGLSPPSVLVPLFALRLRRCRVRTELVEPFSLFSFASFSG